MNMLRTYATDDLKRQEVKKYFIYIYATIYELSTNKKFERGNIYNKTPSGSGVMGGEGKVGKLPMKRQDSKPTLWYIIPYL